MTSRPDLSRQRICVLGGGGFLGSHLVEALLARERCEVTVVDTSLAKLQVAAEDERRLRRVEATVQDVDMLRREVEACDLVVSMTALCNPSLYNTRPREVIEANYSDLVPLVDLCTEQKRWLVHLSTCEVYGRPGDDDAVMNEEQSPLVLGPVNRERWTYACAKQLLERVIWAQGRHHGLPWTIVRPFNVIGARMDFLPGIDGEGIPRVLACFMGALLSGEPLKLVDGGRSRRSFVDVGDFTEALLLLLRNPGACQGEIVNIGNPDNELSIAELARMMARVYGRRRGGDEPRLQDVTSEAFYGEGYEDVSRRIPDISKIRRLGWRPTTTLEQMLPGIIDDYVTRHGGGA